MIETFSDGRDRPRDTDVEILYPSDRLFWEMQAKRYRFCKQK